MEPIAVYQRTITASLERIWENVLDWEHLPWLHSFAFAGIRPIRSGADGWTAEVTSHPSAGGRSSTIEVALNEPSGTYVTRTIAGGGTGTEIHTTLEPTGDHATAITVRFFVPGLDESSREAVGEIYRDLYARLWNEDEEMMIRRQHLLDTGRFPPRASLDAPKSFSLGPASELRGRLPLEIEAFGAMFRVLENDGALVAHPTVCPHSGGPLGGDLPAQDGCLTCPWHGLRFRLDDGRDIDGGALRLRPRARVEEDPGSALVSLVLEP